MIIFPAVDLQKGKAVRLQQGKAELSTVFADNPLDAALAWQRKGAEWLHLIDLDGAFDGHSLNGDIVRRITAKLDIPVQLGGGIRDLAGARAWFAAGVERLIIGTVALEDTTLFADICAEFPGRVGVSLDAERGLLKTRGWLKDTGLHIDQVLPRLVEAGAAFVIYTDISRDGMQAGVNLPDLTHLAQTSPIPVIAAGGVNSLDDIQALYPLSKSANLQGVISGKALYEGSLDLEQAQAWLRNADQS